MFQELEELSERWPVIVEGARDVAALRKLGITKNVTPLNKGKPVFSFCEDLSKKAKVAVILTDWDRRGGQLARMLKDGLEANDRVRTQIVILSKKEVKDMESMPTFIDRLKAMALSQRL